jgi:hypothetical protein
MEPDHGRTNHFSECAGDVFRRFLIRDRKPEWRSDHQRRAELQEGATADATPDQALIDSLENS